MCIRDSCDLVEEIEPAHILELLIGHGNSHFAEVVYQLQSGCQGIQFERPTEQPDLYCVCVGQIYSSIPSGTGVLRMRCV